MFGLDREWYNGWNYNYYTVDPVGYNRVEPVPQVNFSALLCGHGEEETRSPMGRISKTSSCSSLPAACIYLPLKLHNVRLLSLIQSLLCSMYARIICNGKKWIFSALEWESFRFHFLLLERNLPAMQFYELPSLFIPE